MHTPAKNAAYVMQHDKITLPMWSSDVEHVKDETQPYRFKTEKAVIHYYCE